MRWPSRSPRCAGAEGDARPTADRLLRLGRRGLTVLREVLRRLPHESTIYLGDNARAPYGPRSDDEVVRFSASASTCWPRATSRPSSSPATPHRRWRCRRCAPLRRAHPGRRPARRDGGRAGHPHPPRRRHRHPGHGPLARLLPGHQGRGPVRRGLRARDAELVPLVEAGQLDGARSCRGGRGAGALLGDRTGDGEFVFPLPAEERIDTLLLGCTHYPLLAPSSPTGRPESRSSTRRRRRRARWPACSRSRSCPRPADHGRATSS